MISKTILVTGATGFLGSQILQALSAVDGIKVIAACRSPNKLRSDFNGEVRCGDLTDSDYLQTLVQDVDVICHSATWAAMWSHEREERALFYQPCIDLIENAIEAGVSRFIMSSTVAVADRQSPYRALDDSPSGKRGFWPHLNFLIDVDDYMQAQAQRGMQMVNLRLGHFVGAGNRLGLVPVLVPRLKSRLVPILGDGSARLPLISDSDLGHSFVRASLAEELESYESFNICGEEFPTLPEVLERIQQGTALPLPWYRVPYALGYGFGWLMESLFPVLPGRAPFLSRSVVHLAEDWFCDTRKAREKLQFVPQKPWQVALDEALDELQQRGYPWPAMSQALPPALPQTLTKLKPPA